MSKCNCILLCTLLSDSSMSKKVFIKTFKTNTVIYYSKISKIIVSKFKQTPYQINGLLLTQNYRQ